MKNEQSMWGYLRGLGHKKVEPEYEDMQKRLEHEVIVAGVYGIIGGIIILVILALAVYGLVRLFI